MENWKKKNRGRLKKPFLSLSSLATTCLITSTVFISLTSVAQAGSDAHSDSPAKQQALLSQSANTISPARKIKHRKDRNKKPKRSKRKNKAYRTIDGSLNNLSSPSMGAAHVQLARVFDPAYSDGMSSLAGDGRPSARAISNKAVALDFEGQSWVNSKGASDFLWQWGQFLDHDIDLTDGVDPAEPANILVPSDDAHFLPGSEIPLNRSIYDTETGLSSDNPRQQINEITAWIDASNVYGSDEERAAALRTLDGKGQLKTNDENLLPFNTFGLPNAGDNGSNSTQLFLAGDVRANEQVGLLAMHTLFVREHNRIAKRLKRRNPKLSGEQTYQKARQLVGGIMQRITYNEFLPALLGEGVISRYRGYNPDIDANISNSFSAAAYRFGHSALSDTLLRLDAHGQTIPEGNLLLRRAFFSPDLLESENDIDPILRGLAKQACQRIDNHLVEDVRSFLFGDPSAGGFDLAALNIQRGRDHGLPSYNSVRMSAGLPSVNSAQDITTDPNVQRALNQAYESVDDIDLWIGGLAEDPFNDSHLGITFTAILKEQFEALRDGDRFWYERTLNRKELRFVRRSTLAAVIRRNTDIGKEIQRNVFLAPSAKEKN